MSNVPTSYAPLGFNYVRTVAFNELATAGLTRVIDLFPIPADGIVTQVGFFVPEFFDGGATSSLNIEIGVTGVDPDGFLAAKQIHVDGTELSSAYGDGAFFTAGAAAGAKNAVVYDAANPTVMSALFTAIGGNLNVLTQGKVTIFAQIVDFSRVS
jgi:hypothetical protein